MPIHRISIVIALALASITNQAFAAEPPPPGDAAIEEQLEQGISLRRAGNDEGALALFLDLEKDAPDSIRLMLHIATAAQATGKWILAYDYLHKAETHKDDPYFQRHKGAIENVERAVNQHVGQFRARGGPNGAEVRLSGQSIGTMPMAAAHAMEVGSYVLEVSRQGYFSIRRPIVISGGGGITQEDVELRPQTSMSMSSDTPPLDPQGDTPPRDLGPPKPAPWWRARWITISLAAVGAGAAVTTGVAFAIREQDASHWNDNSRCLGGASDPAQTRGVKCGSLRHDIDVAQDVGTVAGITAVVFGTAAIAHLVATSPKSQEATAPSTAHADCAPGLGGIACYGTF